jgi:chemotaxis receptor (MCP) glutamine deamidase CheD
MTRSSGRADVTVYLGGLHVSTEPVVIRTLLGSCIGVCLYDAERRIGGLNHFMLPRGGNGSEHGATRFGVHAMDCLVTAMLKAGGNRKQLVAKVFGGARILDLDSSLRVHQQNIDFIHEYLECEGFRLISEDVGGTCPREVRFHTDTGRAFVRKLPSRRAILDREPQPEAPPMRYGPTILFDRE